MTLSEFTAYALNKKQIEFHSFNPNAVFQCTDLANEYIDLVWQLEPIIGTDAKDFPERLKPGMEFVKNTIDYLPEPGEIAVWSGKVGNGAGHIAIVLKKGLQTVFYSLDQNWSQPLFITQEKHSYGNVRGFIRKVSSTQESMPEDIQSILTHFKVKSLDELKTMVDQELAFLASERTKNTNLKQEFDNFILEVVEKLNPMKPLPAVTDKTFALALIDQVIDSESKLQKELVQKEKEWALEKSELKIEQKRLTDRISELEQQLFQAQGVIANMSDELSLLKKDLAEHKADIEEVKEVKTFLDVLKSLLWRAK